MVRRTASKAKPVSRKASSSSTSTTNKKPAAVRRQQKPTASSSRKTSLKTAKKPIGKKSTSTSNKKKSPASSGKKKTPVSKSRNSREKKIESLMEYSSHEFEDGEERKFVLNDSDDESSDDDDDPKITSNGDRLFESAVASAKADLDFIAKSSPANLPSAFGVMTCKELRSNVTKAQLEVNFEDKRKTDRAMNAEEYGKFTATQVKLSAIKPGSQRQYSSNMNTVQKYGYAWTFKGMEGFLLDGKVAAKVNNNSCQCILSTFKFFNTIMNNGTGLTAEQEANLRLIIKGRRNLCPDMPRIVGAITRDRLAELHDLYKLQLQRKVISPEEYKELYEVSTLMYACALRIFQLRLLHKGSISFHKNGKEAWVTVRSKCTKNRRFVETKEVHPDFIDEVKRIVDERSAAGHTTLFPLWHKPTGSTCPTQLFYERLMKKINLEAAHLFGWPSCLAYHGTHNFRHGAAQDAYHENGLACVMVRTGHVSKNCALHYARSDLERLKAAEYLQLSCTDQRDQANDWVEKCRTRAASATANCRSGDIGLVHVPRPHPTLVEEQERISVLRSVEEQREALHRELATTTGRRNRDPEKLYVKREDASEIELFDSKKGKFVKKFVPTLAMYRYVVPRMWLNVFETKMAEFHRDHPDATFKVS